MKKLIAVCLVIVGVLTTISISLAAPNTQQSVVKYEQQTSYRLSIPETIILNDAGKQDPTQYEAALKNVILQKGTTMSVSVLYDGTVSTKTGETLPYSLYQNNDTVLSSGSEILTANAGETERVWSSQFGAAITDAPRVAGHYEGTATFKVSLPEYTMADIEADDHLEAIGKTRPEYVVAKYSEDFSHIDIIKNGATSDGLMADFNSTGGDVSEQTYSPLTVKLDENGQPIVTGENQGEMEIDERWDLVESITIHSGVENVGSCIFMDPRIMQGEEPENYKTVDLGDVTTIDSLAFSCAPFKNVTIPATVQKVCAQAFYFAGFTEEINFESSPENADRVLTVEGLGRWMTSLKTINFPEENVKVILSDSFFDNLQDAIALQNLKFPKTVSLAETHINTMPGSLVHLSETVTFDCNIPDDFWVGTGSTGTKTIILGPNVDSVGTNAFDVTTLQTVVISKNVNSIGENAFPKGVTIKGESGSYAETWASENGYTFIAE